MGNNEVGLVTVNLPEEYVVKETFYNDTVTINSQGVTQIYTSATNNPEDISFIIGKR